MPHNAFISAKAGLITDGVSTHQSAMIPNMSSHDYRQAVGVNASLLAEVNRSPRHAHSYLTEGGRKETNAMKIGTLLHLFVLEPDKARNAFVVRPDKWDSWRSKDSQQWQAEQELAGRCVLIPGEKNHLLGMINSACRCPDLIKMIEESQTEVSFFAPWTYGYTIQRKARVDIFPAGNGLLDLKTCVSASKRDFENAIEDRLYHMRAAFYLDACRALGYDKVHFVFVAIEKTPPYECVLYKLSQKYIQDGRKTWMELAQKFMDCAANDKWPGYFPDGSVQEIDVPKWRKE